MAARTKLYIKLPWTGGINSSVDPGVLTDNDLVQADNIIMKTSGARTKREGIEEFGNPMPSVAFRSSSGTTRTLVFSDTISDTVPVDEILTVGEKINVLTDSASPEGEYAVTQGTVLTISTTTTTNDTITYTGTTSLTEGSTAVTDLTLQRASNVLNLVDYWRFDTNFNKTQVLLSATDEFKLFSYNSAGNRTEIAAGTSAEPSLDIEVINSIVMSNTAVFAFNRKTNLPIKYRPEDAATYELLGGSPPDFSLMAEHLGRLWVNDKSEPDRIHYSATGNIEEWNGTSDSGAIDISLGDGDSRGITAIYVYKGILLVAKGRRLFRIDGDAPENFKISPVSSGIGVAAHESAVSIDQDDVLFVSARGFHSTIATDAYGDTETNFISAKIQQTFNDRLNDGILNKVKGVYFPELNSAVWALSENDSTNNALYFYHVVFKEWYRWPDISCQSIATRLENDKTRLIIGTDDGRVLIAQNREFKDFGADPISYRIKTGRIYPGGNPQSMKAFKRIGFLYKPLGAFDFTVQAKIDNLPTQSFTFTQPTGGDSLDVDFVLGTSILGIEDVLAPFMFTMEGYGRGVTLTITQNSVDQQVEIYGFILEFEEIEHTIQEVV